VTLRKQIVINCDGCGKTELAEAQEAVHARVEISRKGWKHLNYQGFLINGKNRSQQWDACPDCELPDPEEVVAKLTADWERERAL
jgi:hypothetical protein